MMSDRTVLVFGATGQQGGAVARSLRKEGWRVRAFVRNPASAAAQGLEAEGCTLVRGDMGDPASIETALADVYGVFSVQPSSGQGVYGVSDADEVAFGTRIADLAVRAGVQHFVYSSVAVAGSDPTGMGHFDSKLAIEAHVAKLAIPTTIVRPSTFMELVMLPGLGLDRGQLTFFTREDQPTQFIAVGDIGRTVAAVFAQPGRFAGQAFEIAGDTVTGPQLVAKLSKATGRAIEYQRFPDEVLADNAFLAGLARLFDSGRMASHADIAELQDLVPGLQTFDTWLAGPGAGLLREALEKEGADVALR